ncbi:MAG: HAD family phosphatase [Tissierellia bacterium]|nr:HAD family phosphatase [Tissierellia bacterium]
MIKNVIFDIGNVILKWDPLGYLAHHYTDYEQIEYYLNLVFWSQTWHDLDRGIMDYDQAATVMTREVPERRELVLKMLHEFHEYTLEPISSTEGIIRGLKAKGYHLYLLSNFMQTTFPIMQRRSPVFAYFDGGIVSAYHKLLKPEDAIYQKLLSEYDLLPEESVFIDDLEPNVTAAERNGIRSIQYRDYHSMLELLRLLQEEGAYE